MRLEILSLDPLHYNQADWRTSRSNITRIYFDVQREQWVRVEEQSFVRETTRMRAAGIHRSLERERGAQRWIEGRLTRHNAALRRGAVDIYQAALWMETWVTDRAVLVVFRAPSRHFAVSVLYFWRTPPVGICWLRRRVRDSQTAAEDEWRHLKKTRTRGVLIALDWKPEAKVEVVLVVHLHTLSCEMEMMKWEDGIRHWIRNIQIDVQCTSQWKWLALVENKSFYSLC